MRRRNEAIRGYRACTYAALLVASVGFGVGCSTSRLDFLHLPPEAALRAVEPGVTTRGEVLRRLGPPEEMRRPANFDRARLTTPHHRRILEEGRVFGDAVYTYASGRRATRSFEIVPFGPALFRVSWTRSTERRWRIEFDEDGVVRTISFPDGLEEEG